MIAITLLTPAVRRAARQSAIVAPIDSPTQRGALHLALSEELGDDVTEKVDGVRDVRCSGVAMSGEVERNGVDFGSIETLEHTAVHLELRTERVQQHHCVTGADLQVPQLHTRHGRLAQRRAQGVRQCAGLSGCVRSQSHSELPGSEL